MVFYIISSLVFFLAFAVVASLLFTEKTARIGAAPLRRRVRKSGLNVLKDTLGGRQPQSIADLGSGWGGFLISTARAFPKAKITGYEISFIPYHISRLRCLFRRRITIKKQDFFGSDIAQHDVILFYLSPYHAARIADMRGAFTSGTIIISFAFPIPDWMPKQERQIKGLVNTTIYLYEI